MPDIVEGVLRLRHLNEPFKRNLERTSSVTMKGVYDHVTEQLSVLALLLYCLVRDRAQFGIQPLHPAAWTPWPWPWLLYTLLHNWIIPIYIRWMKWWRAPILMACKQGKDTCNGIVS